MMLLAALVVTTYFDGTESPLSEAGRWRKASNPWHHVQKKDGKAMPSAANQSYDDSYALLSGFPSDVKLRAVVVRSNNLDKSCAHEVELLMRMTDTGTSVKGYEVLLDWSGTVQIMRWNGAMGNFTPIGDGHLGREVATDDVFEAKIVGNRITAYMNGGVVAEATDSKYTTGQPGVGFFRRSCGSNSDLSLTSYKATGL